MIFTYTHPETGILQVFYAAPKGHLEEKLGSLSDADYRAHVEERLRDDLPAGVTDLREMPAAWRPLDDRTFRDAWRLNGDKCSVDMVRARDCHRGNLRRQRGPLLQALDVEALRGVEKMDSKVVADVAARKQKLRDAPAHPDIEAAATPDELKALTIDVLTQ